MKFILGIPNGHFGMICLADENGHNRYVGHGGTIESATLLKKMLFFSAFDEELPTYSYVL